MSAANSNLLQGYFTYVNDKIPPKCIISGLKPIFSFIELDKFEYQK